MPRPRCLLYGIIFARYRTEDAERRKGHVWMYAAALRNSERFAPDTHAALQRALGDWLGQRGLLR